MNEQLTLHFDPPPVWFIDEHTRAVGRSGLEDARRALRQALRRAGAQEAA